MYIKNCFWRLLLARSPPPKKLMYSTTQNDAGKAKHKITEGMSEMKHFPGRWNWGSTFFMIFVSVPNIFPLQVLFLSFILILTRSFFLLNCHLQIQNLATEVSLTPYPAPILQPHLATAAGAACLNGSISCLRRFPLPHTSYLATFACASLIVSLSPLTNYLLTHAAPSLQSSHCPQETDGLTGMAMCCHDQNLTVWLEK